MLGRHLGAAGAWGLCGRVLAPGSSLGCARFDLQSQSRDPHLELPLEACSVEVITFCPLRCCAEPCLLGKAGSELCLGGMSHWEALSFHGVSSEPPAVDLSEHPLYMAPTSTGSGTNPQSPRAKADVCPVPPCQEGVTEP